MPESSEGLWIDRSHQRWKLIASNWLPLPLVVVGVVLFLRAKWPSAFYGLLAGMAGALLSAAFGFLIRCPLCGYRAVFDAPLGRWYSHTTGLRECPRCGDPGDESTRDGDPRRT